MASEEEISTFLKHRNWDERISFLYKKEIMADCYFVIGEGEGRVKIPAHKFVLSASSKEFFNIFFLMEAGSNEIFVNDFSINILNTFLKFVYNIPVSLDMNEVWDILRISRLYGVENIIEKCTELIGKNITDDNLFIVLNKAISFQLHTVDLMCLDLLKRKTIEIFQNPHFLDIEKTTLQKILQCDTLPGKQIEIYRIVMNWIDNKLNVNNLPNTSENRKNCLGHVVKDIDFGSMTISEFSECSEDDNSILSKDEMLDIYRCIGKRHCEFNIKSRESLLPEKCLRNFESCNGTHKLTFFSNRDHLVSGLSLFRRCIHPKIRGLEIFYRYENISYFIEDEDHNKIAEDTAQVIDNGFNGNYHVFFKEQFFLLKGKKYDVTVNVNRSYLDILNDIPFPINHCGGVQFLINCILFAR